MCISEGNDDVKVQLTPVEVKGQGRPRNCKRVYLVATGVIIAFIALVIFLVMRSHQSSQDSSSSVVGGYPSASSIGTVPSSAPSASSIGTVPSSATSAPSRPSYASISISVPDYVENVILSVSIFGGSEFDDSRSYQSRALKWLQADATDDNGLLRMSDRRLIQRYALACIYFATNAVSHAYTDLEFGFGWVDPWDNSTGWLSPASACEWYGITCGAASSESSNEMYVVELRLNENHLTGYFPREVTLLTHLKLMDLYDNWLWNKGDEGNAWLGDMVSLEYLYYGSTYFEYDGIPTQISQLVNLKEYDCSYTLYRGPLLGEPFVGLDSLEYLSLGGNAYDSSVPLEIASLPNLKRLYMEESSLTGSLDFVASMDSMLELWLDSNDFHGTIPTTIGAVTTLGSLSLSNNFFIHGTIPTEMANVKRMEQMWLYNNTLTGNVPSELGYLESMKILYLDGSRLTGEVPSQVCNLKSSGSLDTLVTDCEQEIVCSCCTSCW
ncbi:hypothetical protein MHU86_192 [Fragilaria crotonensis]|nr:hypothetical protein MHU86_192 [Fragilaria crotonensis]